MQKVLNHLSDLMSYLTGKRRKNFSFKHSFRGGYYISPSYDVIHDAFVCLHLRKLKFDTWSQTQSLALFHILHTVTSFPRSRPIIPVCLGGPNNEKFGKLIPGKNVNIVATRCHILKLKCATFDFGWGSATDPAGEESLQHSPRGPIYKISYDLS